MRAKIGSSFWKQEDELTEEQQERLRKLEHDEANRRAQGFLCGACKFYKPKVSKNEGTCLKSYKGIKNETKIFDNCGGPRIVYEHECHTCFSLKL